MFVVFRPSGEFHRVEHDVRRAERFKLEGYTVYNASAQKLPDGYDVVFELGTVQIRPGTKTFVPKEESKKKKIDALTTEK